MVTAVAAVLTWPVTCPRWPARRRLLPLLVLLGWVAAGRPGPQGLGHPGQPPPCGGDDGQAGQPPGRARPASAAAARATGPGGRPAAPAVTNAGAAASPRGAWPGGAGSDSPCMSATRVGSGSSPVARPVRGGTRCCGRRPDQRGTGPRPVANRLGQGWPIGHRPPPPAPRPRGGVGRCGRRGRRARAGAARPDRPAPQRGVGRVRGGGR
jgi:hypothetical protein